MGDEPPGVPRRGRPPTAAQEEEHQHVREGDRDEEDVSFPTEKVIDQ